MIKIVSRVKIFVIYPILADLQGRNLNNQLLSVLNKFVAITILFASLGNIMHAAMNSSPYICDDIMTTPQPTSVTNKITSCKQRFYHADMYKFGPQPPY